MLNKWQGRRRGWVLIAIAAIAGILAGSVAVYVSRTGQGNGGDVAAACAGALATARQLAPLATGEVAAFRVAETADRLSDLAFNAPEGSPMKLATFAGKTVLVNLWATWCVPCREEMPTLDRLQADLGGDEFAVVAINVDVRNEERARAFLDETGVTRLAFYSDATFGVFNELKRRGLAFGLPVSLLVDERGCRIGDVAGPAQWDSADAKALIRAAIE